MKMKEKARAKARLHRERLRRKLLRELPEARELITSCETFSDLEHAKAILDSIKASRPHPARRKVHSLYDLPREEAAAL